MIWKITIVALLAVGASADIASTIQDLNQQQYKDKLKDYCTRNGAADKFDGAEKSIKDFVDCLKDLVNVETLKTEIEQAKPNGALDEVFKKYCAKSPKLKTCIHNLTNGVSPCLQTSLRSHVAGVDNATDQLIDFVCYKDGDRIALFIAEGGPECFQEKANDIRTCAESVKGSISNAEEATALTLKEQCGKFDTLSACVVKALEGCSTPTPGNMAESLLRYVKNGSPCKGVK